MTAATLHIGKGLLLPLEAITETIALLGVRGSGKTSTAVVLAEELLACGQQVIAIDPTDVWWGIKSSKSGDRAGYPVVVLGGRHADLPLAAGDGAVIADFAVDEGVSLILSLRHFESKGEMQRFITDFARRLYHRKGQATSPTPVMVMIDEASIVVPQRVMGDEAQMVGAIQRLVRQGRSSGIGVTLIDQRPATVNKDVLAMLELLVCHRVTSPQDRKALLAWVEQHDANDRADTFLARLAMLERGHAWFWSPGWLDVFQEVHVRERRTFDSSYTPKPGERIQAPTKTAELDLDALKSKLGQSIEKAKGEDPRELKKRIRELESQLKAGGQGTRVVEKAVVDEAATQRAVSRALENQARLLSYRNRDAVKAARGVATQLEKVGAMLTEAIAPGIRIILTALEVPVPTETNGNGHSAPTQPASVSRPARPAPRSAAEVTPRAEGVSRPQQRMLDALASLQRIGLDRVPRRSVAVLSDQSPRSSGFDKNMSTLRTLGLTTYPDSDTMALTTAGARVADAGPDIPSLADLHAAWAAKVSRPQWRMCEALIRVYPDSMDRSALAAESQQSVTSSGYEKNLSTLRSLGLIDYPTSSDAVATELLFPEGLS